MTRFQQEKDRGSDRLLDADTAFAPTRLTEDENRQMRGVDWVWRRPHRNEDWIDD